MIEESQSRGAATGTKLLTETETMLRLPNGPSIFARAWSPPSPQRVVVCIQGLGGHGGYYRLLAEALAANGTALAAPDLRGHGRSEGARGTIDRFDRYLEDVDAALRWVQTSWPGKPIILLGESMGASIAIQYIATSQRRAQPVPLAGLALISPVLRPTIQPSFGEATRYLRYLLTAPSRPAMLTTGREELGCRDNAFNDQLRADPLFVRKVSVRFLNNLSIWLWQTRRKAAQVNLRLLVLRGERDYIAHHAATAAFVRRVATRDQRVITLPEAYHCLLYDPATPQVVEILTSWLAAYPAAPEPAPLDQ
ncbi:MAG TPA: lysophospholipase [Ktedonobacterales bacterium]|nr:lysophospholipase [Ktedonobacterales bacterium]